MVFLVVLLTILIFIIVAYFKYRNYDKDRTENIFIDRKKIISFLKEDPDNYYKTFKDIDLAVRKVNSIDDYKRKIDSSIDEFTERDKKLLMNCIRDANHYLYLTSYPWFNGSKCANIPWKIGCVIGKDYEEGLPHTRKHLILLPRTKLGESRKNLIKVLIHEKIHVYQKMYPEDVAQYLKVNGFKKYKELKYTKSRANPDTDNWIYKDKNGIVYSATYKDNAKSILDVKYNPGKNQISEHPFEKMAIEISDAYM